MGKSIFISTKTIKSYQSGVRPGHSEVIAASKVLNDVVSTLDNEHACVALYIDLSKSFDTVDHRNLLQCLECIHFHKKISCYWFRNYLSRRTQAFVADGHQSSFVSVNKAVPQGSTLGPLLLTFF